MTHQKSPQTSAEIIRELTDAKQKHAQQTPHWPGAKEQAKPQPAGAQPANLTAPGKLGNTPPSKAG